MSSYYDHHLPNNRLEKMTVSFSSRKARHSPVRPRGLLSGVNKKILAPIVLLLLESYSTRNESELRSLVEAADVYFVGK